MRGVEIGNYRDSGFRGGVRGGFGLFRGGKGLGRKLSGGVCLEKRGETHIYF